MTDLQDIKLDRNGLILICLWHTLAYLTDIFVWKNMEKIKLKTLQIIGIDRIVATRGDSKNSFWKRIKLIRLMIKRKAVTRAKRKEIKKYNFETAACWRDKEKALLKQINKLF